MEENECAKKLSFLYSGSFISLPECNVKLKSILNLHAANIAEIFNLKLPKDFNSNNMTCPYCFTHYSQYFNSFKLLPSTGKKFKKQILNKNSLVGDITMNDTANNMFCTRNKLILKCQVCTKNSKFILEKHDTYKEKNQKHISNVILKRTKMKNNNLLPEGKPIFELDCNKIKKKTLGNKRMLTPSSIGESKPIISNSKKKKNWTFTKFATESNQQTEPVLQLDSKQQFSANQSKNYKSAAIKKKRLNHLRKAVKNESKIHKNSLKDLLTVIRK